ncbi:putative signal transducing protein [Marinicauda pacifica]|uniref:putative signal transducing protein n=1 Tax=Marinicauda pacifica TaxID=1133559 RepID=UPI0035C864B4
MKEVYSTNDPVQLSFVEAVLKDARLSPVTLDSQTASIFGGAVPWVNRRVLVADEDWEQARQVLKDALGEAYKPPNP